MSGPPRTQSTMTSEAATGNLHSLPAKLVSVLNDTRNLWLPATIICKANNGSYLVQVIGGGQHRHAHDHIWEYHPDAVIPDLSSIG